jgi:hypothetical protein
MIPLQVDPAWYERRWYSDPPPRPGRLARLRTLARALHRAATHAVLRVNARAMRRPLAQTVSQTQTG